MDETNEEREDRSVRFIVDNVNEVVVDHAKVRGA